MAITTSQMLSHIIREFRYQQNCSQIEVARLAGLKQATISAFENNPDSTKLETLFKIWGCTR
ncbi:helix-turn-helix domain-containing protein [Muribacter muris]|uniref:Helix-turn-helix domain-containing protein n=1 Tax=Muribacter muris TaxID=67855 RepID=A0A4Y9JN38_9PAST|nr:helix-turn-helix domain-containing protein [Muribacter muris]MBF0786292.1 helix-turn-helix domain-containing protein [Muribacter muris]MBF0827236.1 helix-turn-helix domain-containing protein [Muribacter muris]TFV07141.1 helix-turn-helix domain-containing protein [Muribacter muris]